MAKTAKFFSISEKRDKKMLIALMIAAFGIILFIALSLMFPGK